MFGLTPNPSYHFFVSLATIQKMSSSRWGTSNPSSSTFHPRRAQPRDSGAAGDSFLCLLTSFNTEGHLLGATENFPGELGGSTSSNGGGGDSSLRTTFGGKASQEGYYKMDKRQPSSSSSANNARTAVQQPSTSNSTSTLASRSNNHLTIGPT
jgi:hypothetical protein